jgi:hypothetical protein
MGFIRFGIWEGSSEPIRSESKLEEEHTVPWNRAELIYYCTRPVAAGGACVVQPTSHLGAMRRPQMRPAGSPPAYARLQ